SSCISARLAKAGKTKRRTIAGMASNAVIVDVRVAVTTVNRMPATSIHRAREEAARPYHQHDQKRDMTGENLPFRIDMRADGLGQADDDAAGERAPQAAEAAAHHCLEGVEEPGRTDAGIEVGAGAEKEA